MTPVFRNRARVVFVVCPFETAPLSPGSQLVDKI